jgi:hypothetical protein
VSSAVRKKPEETHRKTLRAQHVVLRPHKSSRKVSGFRVNPVTQQPFGVQCLSKLSVHPPNFPIQSGTARAVKPCDIQTKPKSL